MQTELFKPVNPQYMTRPRSIRVIAQTEGETLVVSGGDDQATTSKIIVFDQSLQDLDFWNYLLELGCQLGFPTIVSVDSDYIDWQFSSKPPESPNEGGYVKWTDGKGRKLSGFIRGDTYDGTNVTVIGDDGYDYRVIVANLSEYDTDIEPSRPPDPLYNLQIVLVDADCKPLASYSYPEESKSTEDLMEDNQTLYFGGPLRPDYQMPTGADPEFNYPSPGDYPYKNAHLTNVMGFYFALTTPSQPKTYPSFTVTWKIPAVIDMHFYRKAPRIMYDFKYGDIPPKPTEKNWPEVSFDWALTGWEFSGNITHQDLSSLFEEELLKDVDSIGGWLGQALYWEIVSEGYAYLTVTKPTYYPIWVRGKIDTANGTLLTETMSGYGSIYWNAGSKSFSNPHDYEPSSGKRKYYLRIVGVNQNRISF